MVLYLCWGALLGGAFFISTLFGSLLPNINGAYSDQRMLGCFAFWLVACVISARSLFAPSAQTRFAPLLCTLLFALVLLAGELYSTEYRVEPTLFVLFFVGAALLGGVLATADRLGELLRGVLLVLVFACLFYGLLSIFNYAFALADGVVRLERIVTWGFPNIRYWSHVATWLIPFLALAHYSNPLKRAPLIVPLAASAGAIWWWILFTTVSRGSLVGIMVGAMLVLVLFGRPALRLIRILGIHAFFGGVLWCVLTIAVPYLMWGDVAPRDVHATTSGRIPLWIEAWHMSLVHFPFGMGPQSWLTHEIITDIYRESRHFAHPHNMYLYWAAEYGWISVLAFMVMAVGALKMLMRCARDSTVPEADKVLLMGFGMSVAAACVHASVSAVFIAPASLLVGFMVVSGFWALVAAHSGAQVSAMPAQRSWLKSVVMAGVLVLFVGWGVFWLSEVWRYHEDHLEDRATYKSPGSIGSPRFWSHGDFPRQ